MANVSFDVILHLRDRLTVLEDWKQVLKPGGKLLFTDAGIVTGPVSNQELYLRSFNGYTQFVPEGFNEAALEKSGFELRGKENQSHGPVANASGRIQVRAKYKDELVEVEGLTRFEQEQTYLETMVALYQRGALARYAYRAVLGAES
jgi:SAM-dependent methyltransferase